MRRRLYNRSFGRGPGGRTGSQGLPPYYVDSVSGNDSNPGTAALPLATLAAAQAKPNAASRGLVLVDGSTFLEELTIPARRSGGGTMPVIDGSDPATTWTAQGTANCWKIDNWSNDVVNGRLVVYEDGVPMTPVADVATCSSTAGSYVKMLAPTGPNTFTVVIHATGDGNPNSNGKSYRITKRNLVLDGLGANSTGLNALRAGINDGSLRSTTGVTRASKLLIEWGGKHHFVVASGEVRDTILYKHDTPPAGEATIAFATFFQDDPRGKTGSLRRVGFLGLGNTVLANAKYSHGLSGYKFDRIDSYGTWAVDVYSDSSFTSLYEEIDGHYSLRCGVFPGDPTATTDVANTATYRRMYVDQSSTGTRATEIRNVTFSDCVWLCRARSGEEVFRPNRSGYYTLNGCNLHFGVANTNDVFWFGNVDTTVNATITNTVFYGGALTTFAYAGKYTGNYNVFMIRNLYSNEPCIGWHSSSGYIYGLANWQAATGQDSQSVTLDYTEQSGANRFYLNDPLTTGDFTINPLAKVYDSAGTAFIGTFPDGTPIVTTAGAQSHYDFTAGAVATGPPTSTPNVPLTRAAAVTWLDGGAGGGTWSADTTAVTADLTTYTADAT